MPQARCALAFGDNRSVMVIELGLHEVVKRDTLAKAEKQLANAYGLDACASSRATSCRESCRASISARCTTIWRRGCRRRAACCTRRTGSMRTVRCISRWTPSAKKHFETALRHLEARIRRETGRNCPVHAVPLEQTDGAPMQENEQERAELCHKAAVEKAASEAQSQSRKSLPVRPAQRARHTSARRPRRSARTISCSESSFRDPIVSVNEAVSAYDMVTIQGEVFFTEHK